MARLSDDPARAARAAERSCGDCSHCCTVLRVDELAKQAGHDCRHQRRGAGLSGCAIHAERPSICRRYHCLWLQGGLEDDERPDRTGGIVDLEPTGIGVRLAIREVRTGAFGESPALQAIAARYREEMPVRISQAGDAMDPDRPFRVLLADGLEHRVEGDVLEIRRDGVRLDRRRLPWAERLGRRLANGLRRLRLALSRASDAG